jgi:hypothetical protein
MKQLTLQEQYNLIKEGKGQADVFVKAAKRQFPNLVRNAATLNEAVAALKNNHIISENLMNPGVVSIGGSAQPDWFKIFKDSIEEAKAVEKKTSKEVTDLEEKNFDYKDKKNIDNVYGEAFLEGYYTEMKDPKNADKSVDELKEMVAKNLAKDQLHYVKDGQFGTKGVGYTDDLPGLKASDTDQMVPVKEGKERVGLLDIMESYSEFQRDDKGAKGVDKKDKGEEDAYGAGVEKGEEIEKKKMKKESVKDRVKEIEKQGSIAALEAKMNALEEEIEMRETKLRMVDENEDLAEFVNPKKLAETKREIKELEKAKDKYKKMHEKMCGGAKKEIVEDNETLEEGETIDESKFKEGDFVRLKNDGGVGPKFAVISTRKMFASKLHAVRVTDENGKTAEYDETQLELVD